MVCRGCDTRVLIMPLKQDLMTVTYTYDRDSDLKEGVFGEWYANGVKAKVGTYKRGKLVGTYKEWYEDGVPKLQCTYRKVSEEGDGGEEFTGQYSEWHPSGVVKVDRLYNLAGKRIDFSATYYYDGQRESLEYYDMHGVKTGEYKEWHSNGAVRKSYTYDAEGEIHGEYKEFTEDGKTTLSEVYEHGKKHGTSFRYTGGCRLVSKEEYCNGILVEKYIHFGGKQNDYLYVEYDADGVFKYKKRVFPATYLIRESFSYITDDEDNNRGVFNIENGHAYYEGVYDEPLEKAVQ